MCHCIGHLAGVLHGLHAEDLLVPLALVAFGELMAGLPHPNAFNKWEVEDAVFMWWWIMPCKIHWDRSTTAHLMSIVLVKESLDLGSHWKATALIVVPLSYCMINRGSYSIASRMACMAAATSAPCLLVRGCTQAHFDTTSVQQKRYLVPSLATRYLLQSTRSHCSYFPRPETMDCHWRCGSAWARASYDFPH